MVADAPLSADGRRHFCSSCGMEGGALLLLQMEKLVLLCFEERGTEGGEVHIRVLRFERLALMDREAPLLSRFSLRASFFSVLSAEREMRLVL